MGKRRNKVWKLENSGFNVEIWMGCNAIILLSTNVSTMITVDNKRKVLNTSNWENSDQKNEISLQKMIESNDEYRWKNFYRWTMAVKNILLLDYHQRQNWINVDHRWKTTNSNWHQNWNWLPTWFVNLVCSVGFFSLVMVVVVVVVPARTKNGKKPHWKL